MPASSEPNIRISAFRWVPDFAQGMVRDIRIRWALEEIDRPYDTSLLDAMQPRDAEYRQWQPFGQVPAFDDGNVILFESGAILLYLGEQDERLLPNDSRERWNSTAWLIAALNSVEPTLSTIVSYDIFHADKDWAKAARPAAVELAEARLQSLSDALGDKDWLTGRFTIADIMMVTVLRNLRHTDILAGFPRLAAYQQRGEQRPAFQRALKAQTETFAGHQPQMA
ncbi:glutathione S-transferase [Sphingopyxis sp. BSNA05]|uniref:glutathione S-transferase family protein n=1 Tax=Sphingopyxis sp. BSNA05 TaxID=1236614 RepID=UPI0015655528|nr:glutathione S-transferase family protein [Sphingopyxis sp. BSNA05]NRD89108.1 glutathione S-transferase [Sphingopyxis sp. BSNA05]